MQFAVIVTLIGVCVYTCSALPFARDEEEARERRGGVSSSLHGSFHKSLHPMAMERRLSPALRKRQDMPSENEAGGLDRWDRDYIVTILGGGQNPWASGYNNNWQHHFDHNNYPDYNHDDDDDDYDYDFYDGYDPDCFFHNETTGYWYIYTHCREEREKENDDYDFYDGYDPDCFFHNETTGYWYIYTDCREEPEKKNIHQKRNKKEKKKNARYIDEVGYDPWGNLLPKKPPNKKGLAVSKKTRSENVEKSPSNHKLASRDYLGFMGMGNNFGGGMSGHSHLDHNFQNQQNSYFHDDDDDDEYYGYYYDDDYDYYDDDYYDDDYYDYRQKKSLESGKVAWKQSPVEKKTTKSKTKRMSDPSNYPNSYYGNYVVDPPYGYYYYNGAGQDNYNYNGVGQDNYNYNGVGQDYYNYNGVGPDWSQHGPDGVPGYDPWGNPFPAARTSRGNDQRKKTASNKSRRSKRSLASNKNRRSKKSLGEEPKKTSSRNIKSKTKRMSDPNAWSNYPNSYYGNYVVDPPYDYYYYNGAGQDNYNYNGVGQDNYNYNGVGQDNYNYNGVGQDWSQHGPDGVPGYDPWGNPFPAAPTSKNKRRSYNNGFKHHFKISHDKKVKGLSHESRKAPTHQTDSLLLEAVKRYLDEERNYSSE